MTGVLEGFSQVSQVPQVPAGSYNIGSLSQANLNFEHPYRSLEQTGGFLEAARPPRSTLGVPVPGLAEPSKQLLRIAICLSFSRAMEIDSRPHFGSSQTSIGTQKP